MKKLWLLAGSEIGVSILVLLIYERTLSIGPYQAVSPQYAFSPAILAIIAALGAVFLATSILLPPLWRDALHLAVYAAGLTTCINAFFLEVFYEPLGELFFRYPVRESLERYYGLLVLTRRVYFASLTTVAVYLSLKFLSWAATRNFVLRYGLHGAPGPWVFRLLLLQMLVLEFSLLATGD